MIHQKNNENYLFKENDVVLNKKSVEGTPCINRESNSLNLTFSYTYVMMNMKPLAVATPPYIYHGCPTLKKFWEEKFTGEEKFTLGEFSAVNMKIVLVTMLGNTERSRVVTSMSL